MIHWLSIWANEFFMRRYPVEKGIFLVASGVMDSQ
jgi:hypothetical protein